MTTYPVHETEMDMIGAFNVQTTAFYSLAGLAIGVPSTIWGSALFVEKLTPLGELGTMILAPLFLVISILFGVLGTIALIHRRGLWEKIKRESVPIETHVGAASMAFSGERKVA